MRRRGFFGIMGGAVVAGPSMVKEAAAATVADLNLGAMGVSGQLVGGPGPASAGDVDHAIRLAKFMALSPERAMQVARKRAYVERLDPDIASYRSFSLSAKIRMQREREAKRWLETERSWLQRAASGIMNLTYDDDY